MRIRAGRFNTNLVIGTFLWIALGVTLAGCRSPEKKKGRALATLRIHVESNERSQATENISVYRYNPVQFTIQKAPFVTEGNVAGARLLEAYGSFSISVQLDRQGAWLLEQYTSANQGRHLAVFSQFYNAQEEKLNQGRWLAAPQITKRITDGLLIFTPDATREEAEQIVTGLTNVAKKLNIKQSEF